MRLKRSLLVGLNNDVRVDKDQLFDEAVNHTHSIT